MTAPDQPCAFGDPTCPCQDGDACHYVALPGSPAMAKPDHYPERVGDLTDAELAEWLRSPDLETEHRKVLQREALHRLPVRRLQGGGYVVASRTTRGAWWLVQPGQGCTCPAEVERCHHMRVVAGYCLLDSAIHARPTPPPNVSALVD